MACKMFEECSLSEGSSFNINDKVYDDSNPKVHFSNDDFSTDIDFNVESRSLKTQYIKLENQTSDVVCHETPTFSVESRHEQTNAIELNEMVSTLKERSSTPKNLSCNVAFFECSTTDKEKAVFSGANCLPSLVYVYSVR
nr:uncharacterized protein LOC124811557 [Hydra vulgaris]